MEFIIDISEPWFTKIKNGEKTIEGKKASPQWIKIKVDDIIIFRNSYQPTFKAKVMKINHYKGPNALQKYFEAEGFARTTPGKDTFEQASQVYLTKPVNWTHEEIDLNGMLAFHIELLFVFI